jgi:hypothetical protein
MITIYKYQLEQSIKANLSNPIALPAGFQALRVDRKEGEPLTVWCMINTEEVDTVYARFAIYGTGMEIGQGLNLEYINTYFEGWYVYHAFLIK